jgi:toxin ParE1/3/4
MTRLVVTPEADADALEILDYLRQEAGARVAEDYARRFQNTLQRLIAHPESGPSRPALGPDARLAIVPPYLLIYDYTYTDDTLTLLRILHGKRNITPRLLRR